MARPAEKALLAAGEHVKSKIGTLLPLLWRKLLYQAQGSQETSGQRDNFILSST